MAHNLLKKHKKAEIGIKKLVILAESTKTLYFISILIFFKVLNT